MKQILIIDESPLFREYLKLKLADNGIEASISINTMDGISKMRNLAPDLIIMDYDLSKQGCQEILRQKKAGPNTANTLVIIMAQHIDQKRLIELIPYNVKKVFTKPVKIDALFTTISQLLGISCSIDESPSIVEVHVNDSIIFIEIARGLNRDKLDLLRFKIIELIDLYEIRIPKVIVMLSNIKLNFADAPNMRKLIETVIHASRAKLNNIRVLTKDDFTRQFISGQKEYAGIEVVSNLQYAVDGLLAEIQSGVEYAEMKAEIIGDKILSADTSSEGEYMQLKFDAEVRDISMEEAREMTRGLKIAAIDGDSATQELIRDTFGKSGASIRAFLDGEEFIAVVDQEDFDLAFLDLNIPKKDGFEVLKALQVRDTRYPVIAFSGTTQRETVIKAFKMGIKGYLAKPLKSEDIFKKSMAILKANS